MLEIKQALKENIRNELVEPNGEKVSNLIDYFVNLFGFAGLRCLHNSSSKIWSQNVVWKIEFTRQNLYAIQLFFGLKHPSGLFWSFYACPKVHSLEEY